MHFVEKVFFITNNTKVRNKGLVVYQTKHLFSGSEDVSKTLILDGFLKSKNQHVTNVITRIDKNLSHMMPGATESHLFWPLVTDICTRSIVVQYGPLKYDKSLVIA